MLTKIKESFLRAWRGEESLKTVLKVWGGSGLVVGIVNFILPILFVLLFMYNNLIAFIFGLIMMIGYTHIYIYHYF